VKSKRVDEQFRRKLKKVLNATFPSATIELVVVHHGQRVGGRVIWDEFEDMEQFDRQEMLWEMLEYKMASEDMNKVGAMQTLTPSESFPSLRAG